jgi:hypothetical protein
MTGQIAENNNGKLKTGRKTVRMGGKMNAKFLNNEPVRQCAPAAGAQIQTKPVKVHITTDDLEIEGCFHVKPGGYKARISDILNVKELHFVPITDAVYRKLKSPDEPPRCVGTLIIRVDTIKMIVPLGEEKNREPAS